VLFDYFNAKIIDPDRWFGIEANSGAAILESTRELKSEPIYGYRGLHIVSRVYGSTQIGDSGITFGGTRLYFKDGTNLRTIEAKIQVKRYEAIGCSSNPAATEVRARIGGAFFNTTLTPTPGSWVNDVLAIVAIRRRSDSTDPPKVLELIGYSYECLDESCSSGNLLDYQVFGTARLGQRVKLRITWDPDNSRFIFQKGKEPPVFSPYGVPNNALPGASNGGGKRLGFSHNIPNCTTAPRPMAYMEAFFDDVKVNGSAAP
jgi:hypothetical protein